MEQRFYDALQDCPIIAAVRDEAGLDACLASDVRMVFTLFGDVCSIPTIVDRIRAANKFAVVHLDRVTGLASKEVAVDFIRQSTRADGVIGDLNKRRGRVMGMNPDPENPGYQIVEAEVPMGEMTSYTIDLRAMSQGRGSYTLKFVRYEEVPQMNQAKIIEDAKKEEEE